MDKEIEILETRSSKKKNSRRILLLLLLIVATGIMLTTTSYAWFTANETVSVNTITVNVAAQNGIQISVDGTAWRSIIQTDDIRGAHAAFTTTTLSYNMLPPILEPVSTAGNIAANGRMDMFYGVVETNAGGDYILTATQETESRHVETTNNPARFIAFDLYLKVDQAADNLYITTDSGVTTADQDDSGIKNATRMAFVIQGNTTAGDTLANVQALNDGTDNEVYIWEPNYNSHTPEGQANGRNVYAVTQTQLTGVCSNPLHTTEEDCDPAAEETWTAPIRVPYEGVIAPIADTDDVLLEEANSTAAEAANNAFFDAVTITYATEEGFTEEIEAFGLLAGITKIRVYMWVEGQDLDCENNASGGNINFDLGFTITEPGA